MGDLLIRNLDDDVIAAWKKRADANGRSLQSELHAELSAAVKAERKRAAIEIAARIRAESKPERMGCESWELIREDRDSR
jgi:plasmid stability protein